MRILDSMLPIGNVVRHNLSLPGRAVLPTGLRLATALLALSHLSCAAEEPPRAEPSRELSALVAEGIIEAGPADLQRFTEPEYFRVRRDLRRCAFPACGGFFVSAENRGSTICADGERRAECYVVDIELSGTNGLPGGIDAQVVRGRATVQTIDGFGEFGFLEASEAFQPLSSADGVGVSSRLGDNGVRCITTPCFSTTAQVLNWPFEVPVSDLDFSNLDSESEEQLGVQQALSTGALVATGAFKPRDGQAGVGTALIASQLYLPSAEPTSRCLEDAECGEGQWCRQAESGGRECVPFVGEGASCNGFTLAFLFERCLPGLRCDTPPFTADAPGVCRAECEDSSDCEESDYCATDGTCRADSECDVPVDCQQSGNLFPQILCIGYPTCGDFGGNCGFSCGDPRCIDLRGADFGDCERLLGYGRVGDSCQPISGCSTTQTLFESEEDCEAVSCGGQLL